MVFLFKLQMIIILFMLPLVINDCTFEAQYFEKTIKLLNEIRSNFEIEISSLELENENFKKIITKHDEFINKLNNKNGDFKTQREGLELDNEILIKRLYNSEIEISKLHNDIEYLSSNMTLINADTNSIKININYIKYNNDFIKSNLEYIKPDITSIKNDNIFYFVKLFNNEYYAYPDGTLAIDCSEYKIKVKNAPSGIYKISSISQNVYCDQSNDDGGWTILIKVRSGDNLDFNKNWVDYKNFFGDLKKSFWLGLENMNKLTYNGNNEVIVDYKFNNNFYQKIFSNIKIGNEAQLYEINVSPTDHMNKMKFTTKDKDNDSYNNNCAVQFNAGWWYEACYDWRLTGDMNDKSYAQGICFGEFTHYDSITYGVMKIRRKDIFY